MADQPFSFFHRSVKVCSGHARDLSKGEDLTEALFGGTGPLHWPEIVFGLVAASAIVLFIITQRNRLVVMLASPDVARTAGINVRRLNLLYLQTFALTALGLRYLGVLLMGALIAVAVLNRTNFEMKYSI